MSGKKLVIIVIAGLGALSFAVSFLLSGRRGAPPAAPPADQAAQAGSQLQQQMALAGLSEDVQLQPKAKQLDELIRDVRMRIAEYRHKVEKLEQREQRLRLAEGLLKTQAKDLEALRMELVAPLTRLKEAKAELEQGRVRIAQEELKNLKRLATTYEKMDATSGSEALTAMCANKQEDDAVKILYFMSERSAAKLLAKMPDKTLVAKLSGKIKKIQQQS